MEGWKNNLGYINVPLMFKYAIAEKFNVEAGLADWFFGNQCKKKNIMETLMI